MPRVSAGLLVYRLQEPDRGPAHLEVLLVHPGGPFWAKRDDGAWSIPKGEHGTGDDAWAAARREFREEIGQDPPAGTPLDLGEVTQSGSKRVHAWGLAGQLDVSEIESNTFQLEWPPRSGHMQSFPEVDRAGWFEPDLARRKLVIGQARFVDRLVALLVAPGTLSDRE